MTNKDAIFYLKQVREDYEGKEFVEGKEAIDLAIKALEKNNEMLEYLKISLSQSDELKEKHRNVDDELKKYHKRTAIIFEGMGEAYADLIDRFFKDGDDTNDG